MQFEKEIERVPEILSIDQIKRLLRTAKDTKHAWYPVWAVALLTGMRNGELFALTWSDVDLENKIITLSRSYNSRTRSFKSTKSGSWRQISISPELELILKELKLSAHNRAEVLPRLSGWKDLETMQIYIRLAEIEVQGVTDQLKLLPERKIMGKVVGLFSSETKN